MRANGTLNTDDTIAAISTPPGTGAIGIVRTSGPEAVRVMARLVRLGQGNLQTAAPRLVHRAEVVDPVTGEALDVALVVKMPAPKSYTGEDVVELSCHGNPALLAEIVRLAVDGGARLAHPGEFTRRAYLNGRLDLVQVESVAEMVSARTDRAIRLAARQLRGALSGEIGALHHALIDLVAGLEVGLDFPDDEIGVSRSDALQRLGELRLSVDRLVARSERGRIVHDGLSVMLTGAPNVGKSSLLNALLGADRAIVSESPGTTRDVIEDSLLIAGVHVRLLDGAGLGVPRNSIDAQSMERARRALIDSDLALVVLDASKPLSDADREVLVATSDQPRLIVGNKSDLVPRCQSEGEFYAVDLTCSALTGSGIPDLMKRLRGCVEERTGHDGDEGGIVVSLRVLDLLGAARTALRQASKGLTGAPIEAVLVDLRDALNVIDGVVGGNGDEAVLDRIFSSFCVGK